MAAPSPELPKREFRKHFELAQTARRFAEQVKALKEHYRAPGGDESKAIHVRGIGEGTPEFYFVRVVHFAEQSTLKAQSFCAAYNHKSWLGCNKGEACTFKYHKCAFCHEDSHGAYAWQRNGTRGEWYYTCKWLRGFERERKQMKEQFSLDAGTAEGLERLVCLSRPVPMPRRPAAAAGPVQIGLKNRFAGGMETESEEEEEAAPGEARADAWEEPQEPACPAPPPPADSERTAAGPRARSTARSVSKAGARGRQSGSTSGAASSRPSAAAASEADADARADGRGSSRSVALAPQEAETLGSSGSAKGAWPTPLEAACPLETAPPGAGKKGRQRSRSAVAASSSGSAAGPSTGGAPGAPQESAHQAPVALAEAGAAAGEPSPPPHEANSRAPRSEQEVASELVESGGVEMPERAEGIPVALVREMLGRRDEQLQESQEEVARLKARIASLERSLRSLESMLLGQGTDEVLGDTGSSVAAASRATSSTTPAQKALIKEKLRDMELEVKNRVKEADKHPDKELNNPRDLLAFYESRIEEEGDAARREELASRLETCREQARAANAARHSNMRSTEPVEPGDLAEFDGTWRSVNGHRSIRDVQVREDEAEITTLERLALFIHTDQPLMQELQGLGLAVQDEIFNPRISRSTVAFASLDAFAGFKRLKEEDRLPRCIADSEPYKYLEKPRNREEAVRFKNMYEEQPVEEFLRALTEFGPVHDVCVKKIWEKTGHAFLGFVEFQGEGGAQRLLDSRFPFMFKGKEHLVIRGPSKYIAFQAWA